MPDESELADLSTDKTPDTSDVDSDTATTQPEPEIKEPDGGEASTQTETPEISQGIESRPGGTEGGMTAKEKLSAAAELAGGSSPGVEQGNQGYAEENGMVINPETGKDRYLTNPVPEGKPVPVEPQDVTFSDVAYTCTPSISCATILDNIDWLDPEKVELVPIEVTFYEGESVFNVLMRTCKQQKIHMEYEDTPIYNSAYIEGIHNLYEFDCGELSGWMY